MIEYLRHLLQLFLASPAPLAIGTLLAAWLAYHLITGPAETAEDWDRPCSLGMDHTGECVWTEDKR